MAFATRWQTWIWKRTSCSIETKPDRKYSRSRWCTFHTFFFLTQTTGSTCIGESIKFLDLFAVLCSKTSLLNESHQNPIPHSYEPVKHKRAPVQLQNKGKERPLSPQYLAPTPSRQASEIVRPLHVLTCSDTEWRTEPGFPENTHSYLARWEICLRGVWAEGCSPPGMAAAAACWNSPDGSDGMAPCAS